MDSAAPFLKVSCLALAEAAAVDHKAELVISLLSADMRAPSFASVATLRKHIAFYFYDQESVLPEGMTDAVAELAHLGQSWRQSGRFPQTLVHCHGGVSRSTAATYILLCAAFPDLPPEAHFETLLRLAPKPWPNMRMIAIADGLLNAMGGMLSPLMTYRNANPNRLDVFRRLNRRRGIVDRVKR
ncbi:MAG: protein tyrosine phosphatase [Alphaproteobacteria bacterium]|nr:protein tyrosine phosphatase [Alphaproteobacteria bacterium]